MTKIEKLTPEQEAKMPEYVEKWCKIGLCCDPTDFTEARHFTNQAYLEAKRPLPNHTILTDSPWSAAVIASLFQRMSEAEIAKWCRTPTLAQEELFPTFSYQNLTYLNEAGKEVEACTKDALRAGVTAQVYGAHDAGWLSFYDFMSEELGLSEVVAGLQPWIRLAKVCGWWAPYDGVCLLEHRHREVHLDDRKQLSNNKGLAVKYADGFGVWVINGLAVDEQVVMRPETQTLKQIEAEPSADIKAIRIAQYGWPKYLEESGAKVIDREVNDVEGTIEVLFKLKDGSRQLLANCAKGVPYSMGVNASCENCEQARRWLSPIAGVNIVGRT